MTSRSEADTLFFLSYQLFLLELLFKWIFSYELESGLDYFGGWDKESPIFKEMGDIFEEAFGKLGLLIYIQDRS